MAPLSNPTLKRRQLGRLLRRFREDTGMTLDQAAPGLEWSPSKLSRIEKGQQSVDVHDVRSMLDLYDIGDRWAEVLDLAREARKRAGGSPTAALITATSAWRPMPAWYVTSRRCTCRG